MTKRYAETESSLFVSKRTLEINLARDTQMDVLNTKKSCREIKIKLIHVHNGSTNRVPIHLHVYIPVWYVYL